MNLNIQFDIICITETCVTNIDLCANLLDDYTFYYELPKSNKGGAGIYVKNGKGRIETRDDLKLQMEKDVEDIWIEVSNPSNNIIVTYSILWRH